MSGIDAYVAELRRLLAGRIPDDLLEARLREARSHLGSSVSDVGEAEALKRFGTPVANARAIFRQARGYATRSAASMSIATGAGLAAALLAIYAWSSRQPEWHDPGHGARALAALIAAFLIVPPCLRARRWLALPVAGWAAMALGLAYAAPLLRPVRLDAAEAESGADRVRDELKEIGRRDLAVAAWRAGNPPADSMPCLITYGESRYVAGVPLAFRVPTARYEIVMIVSPAAPNREDWDEHGAGWASTLREKRLDAMRRLAAFRAGLAVPPPSLAEQVKLWGFDSIGLALALAALNGLALLLGQVLDDLPPRRRRVLSRR